MPPAAKPQKDNSQTGNVWYVSSDIRTEGAADEEVAPFRAGIELLCTTKRFTSG
jgi:hypothetical protein